MYLQATSCKCNAPTIVVSKAHFGCAAAGCDSLLIGSLQHERTGTQTLGIGRCLGSAAPFKHQQLVFAPFAFSHLIGKCLRVQHRPYSIQCCCTVSLYKCTSMLRSVRMVSYGDHLERQDALLAHDRQGVQDTAHVCNRTTILQKACALCFLLRPINDLHV